MIKLKLRLDDATNTPKHEQIAYGIIKCIENKELRKGDILPSLKKMSDDLGVSCATVAKAYDTLKKRGIIESVPYKGYHIARESVSHDIRIFLLFDQLNMFKEGLYNAFKAQLAEKAMVDIFFHHYNPGVFESLISDNIGRFSHYIIMPFYHRSVNKVINEIDPEKLLILDQPGFLNEGLPGICQDFEGDVQRCLMCGLPRIRKYQRLNLFYPEPNIHPKAVTMGFKRFCIDNGIPHTVYGKLEPELIQPNQAYIVISDAALVQAIKTCQANQYEVGRDVGIISYNDTPLNEIIAGGVTTISTDFARMGRRAAEMVLSSERIREINIASLIIRNSL